MKDAYAKLSDEKKRDRTILVIEGARERCRQERAFKLSKGVDPATLPPEEEALQKEVAKTFAQNEMKRRDVEEHNRVQQQRERDQAAEAEKKEADEKLFEKQWNTDDRYGAGWELLRETRLTFDFRAGAARAWVCGRTSRTTRSARRTSSASGRPSISSARKNRRRRRSTASGTGRAGGGTGSNDICVINRH